MEKPYVAAIGAAQTFGRYVERPYPLILSELINMPVINLGRAGRGPSQVEEAELEILNNAQYVIVQVMSARSTSNSEIEIIDGQRGIIRATGEKVAAEDFYKDHLPERAKCIKESKQFYVNEMIDLLQSIKSMTTVLWMADRKPGKTVYQFPHFVSASDIDDIVFHTDNYVEAVLTHEGYYPSQELHNLAAQRILES